MKQADYRKISMNERCGHLLEFGGRVCDYCEVRVIDPRIAVGHACTWWGSAELVASSATNDNQCRWRFGLKKFGVAVEVMPCCPCCGSLLHEVANRHTFFEKNREFDERHQFQGAWLMFIAWLENKCLPSFMIATSKYEIAIGQPGFAVAYRRAKLVEEAQFAPQN
jgi:hypothetical protein